MGGIISLIDEIGLTGNSQIDTYLSALKTEKESVKVKLEGLVNANSQNIGVFCTTLQSTASSTSTGTTAATPLELIKESASSVKTETDTKIAQLNAILANSDLSPNVKEALESLLSMLMTLSGDFGTIATAGETTTITTTTESITTTEAIQQPGRFKRDLTCSEMASSYNTAIAKVDLILEKLVEITSLETPPSEEVVEFCEAASADFNALKNDTQTGRASRMSC